MPYFGCLACHALLLRWCPHEVRHALLKKIGMVDRHALPLPEIVNSRKGDSPCSTGKSEMFKSWWRGSISWPRPPPTHLAGTAAGKQIHSAPPASRPAGRLAAWRLRLRDPAPEF